jgi:hypothetical protein
MKLIREHLAEDVAEVEVGVGEALDLAAADFAEVALFAAGHATPPGKSG